MDDKTEKPSIFTLLKIAYHRMVSDRRKYLRLPLRVKVTNRHTDMFEHFSTTNISEGGLFIKTEVPFAIGTLLKMELQLPTMDEKIAIDGTVVRIMLPGSEYQPGMGIQFSDSDKYPLQIVKKFVKENMNKEE